MLVCDILMLSFWPDPQPFTLNNVMVKTEGGTVSSGYESKTYQCYELIQEIIDTFPSWSGTWFNMEVDGGVN